MFSIPATVVFVCALHISLANKDGCTFVHVGTDTWMWMCSPFLELTHTPVQEGVYLPEKAWITKVTKILRLHSFLLLLKYLKILVHSPLSIWPFSDCSRLAFKGLTGSNRCSAQWIFIQIHTCEYYCVCITSIILQLHLLAGILEALQEEKYILFQ